MKTYFYIANAFGILIDSTSLDNPIKYLKKEYHDFNCSYIPSIPLFGKIAECGEKFNNSTLRELVKDRLYEDNNYLYIRNDNKYIRINITNDYFELNYESDYDGEFLFHIIEVLIRIFSHKAGIDYFHASSFIFKNKVYMLNGFGGSGKTEIMINFLLRGASFISDDLVIINEHGAIYPYRVTIPLRWSAINEEFVNQLKIPKAIYRICKFCKEHNNTISRRIYEKLVWRYLIGNYSYSEISSLNSNLKFYNVDYCFWLQDSNHEGSFAFSNIDYYNYMNLCLENESRKYFDLEGFLKLKFPIIETFNNARSFLRQRICGKLSVSGFAIKQRNYIAATDYITYKI